MCPGSLKLFLCYWHLSVFFSSTKNLDTDVSFINWVDDVLTVSSEDADDVQWYDSLQLWYLFRQTLWQQDVSLSKALAQSIPS